MKTITFGETHGCTVLAHGVEAPTDAEWALYLTFLQHHHVDRGTRVQVLVVTSGGAPTPKQRNAMEVAFRPHLAHGKVAIVTSSTFVRGVVNAFRIVRPIYRAFEPTALSDALAYLGLSPAQFHDVEAMVPRLQAELRAG